MAANDERLRSLEQLCAAKEIVIHCGAASRIHAKQFSVRSIGPFGTPTNGVCSPATNGLFSTMSLAGLRPMLTRFLLPTS